MPDIGYIAYIDEAGDFGLRSVLPIDDRGASEWLIMSAVVIRKENELKVPNWLKEIRDEAKNRQSPDLHFRKLNDRQKSIVCGRMADLPMRLFVVISNKQNMRGHRNKQASNISQHKHWFYLWLTRLLLERVTDFCALRNAKDGTPGKKLQIEFSRRKDIRRNHFTDYFTRLWHQGERAYLIKRTINWSVFDFNSVDFFDHKTRAGLQFADVLASSFFQAVNTHPHGDCYPEFATQLKPLIFKKGNVFLDEGFTVWPGSLTHIEMSDKQKKIFMEFGFSENDLPK